MLSVHGAIFRRIDSTQNLHQPRTGKPRCQWYIMVSCPSCYSNIAHQPAKRHIAKPCETPITSFSNNYNKPGFGILIAPTCQSFEQNNPRFWTAVTNRYLVVLVSHWTNLTYGNPRMATFSLAGKSWKSIKQVICSGPSTKHHLPKYFHKDSTNPIVDGYSAPQ